MKSFLVFSILFLSGIISYTQFVSTIVDSLGVKFRDDIILDQSGNIYCSDYSGTNVYQLTPDGGISIFVTGLNTPNGLAFDSQNNLFVCDHMGNAIYKVSPAGDVLDTISTNRPSGLITSFDSDTLIFTEYGNSHQLKKLAPDGSITTFIAGPPLNGPVGLTYDNLGQLYVANFNNRQVFKVVNNTLEYLTTVPGPSSGFLGFLAYGGGYLWATSWNANKIYGIDPNFTDSTFVYAGSSNGGMDGELSVATFNSPNGIYVNDNADTMYISEYNTGRLRMISPESNSIESQLSNSDPDLQIEVYPNPSIGDLQIINHSDHKILKISVYNLLGEQVQASSYNDSYTQITIEDSGVYFIVSTLENNHQIVTKVIISK